MRRAGRAVPRYAGPDRATALEVAARWSREQDRLRLLGEVPPCQAAFEDFVEQYLKHAKQRMTRSAFASRDRLVRGVLLPHFRGRLLTEIQPHDVQRFLGSRPGRAGGTINRYLTALSALYRHAKSIGLPVENPVRGVERAKEPRIPIPLMTHETQDALLASIQEPMRTLFLLLLDTGARLAEALHLVWSDVDLASGSIQVRQTKAKRPRLLAMTDRLRQALLALSKQRVHSLRGPDPVFPGAMTEHEELQAGWRSAFKRAAARIGVPSLRIHDLRHLCAVNLVRAGLDLPTVQGVLGHTSLLSTMRYAEYSDQSAAVRAARVLDGLRAQSHEGR